MNQKNTKNAAVLSGVTLGLLTLAGCGHNTTPPLAIPATAPGEKAPFNDETPSTPVIMATSSVSTTSTVTTPKTNSTSTAPAPVSKNTYKDGSYTVVGSYKSPAGAEELGVTVILKNDIITSSDVVVKATAIKSVKMQQDFAANYKPMVIGKDIDTVTLGKVSGSSLTPLGFNEALAKIKVQAK